ncbi:M15 family metallopeptidase [Acerihabitans arboris]|uniref:D-alanyl-D-alanine carboxypeptidase family protein n=1 Tax=Acerihabitans arboris TaxID=2691583 RepID=A0A845SR57_9GAMM|nr:M15 family metallopeptidase [Acerihabitans arboris]NDL65414.1 D-alanyl-D-alanine carboxypeptidase family protein [Acerihabitans arboris]
MMTPAMLTGQTDRHLAPLCGAHRLQPEAINAFQQLQRAARQSGFNLLPASSFRDFDRQLAIWNGKFRGERPLLDNHSRPLDSQSLAVGERCHAILRWSALPGASRHHWGSDLDVYDPDLLPAGTSLQLEPWEYLPGGYLAPLADWLGVRMAEYGFYRPYAHDRGGVAAEPWHLSYRPLAQVAERLLTPDLLLASWKDRDVAGASWLTPRLPAIFRRYIGNVDKE